MVIETDVETRLKCFGNQQYKEKSECDKSCCFIEYDLCNKETVSRIDSRIYIKSYFSKKFGWVDIKLNIEPEPVPESIRYLNFLKKANKNKVK